jgi:hypothetical protein
MKKPVSRQQRRASERAKTKRGVANDKARRLAAKRAALARQWRRRDTLTAWQRLAIGVEFVFYVLGGPLVWAFYNVGWWFEKSDTKRS